MTILTKKLRMKITKSNFGYKMKMKGRKNLFNCLKINR